MSLDPITDPAVRPAFHLAIPVDDLVRAAEFYGGVLGLPRGRSSADAVGRFLTLHTGRTLYPSLNRFIVSGKYVKSVRAQCWWRQ